MEFLGPVPTVWDETRVLDGAIGRLHHGRAPPGPGLVSRAMTDWTPRELESISVVPARRADSRAVGQADDLAGIASSPMARRRPNGDALHANEEPVLRRDPPEGWSSRRAAVAARISAAGLPRVGAIPGGAQRRSRRPARRRPRLRRRRRPDTSRRRPRVPRRRAVAARRHHWSPRRPPPPVVRRVPRSALPPRSDKPPLPAPTFAPQRRAGRDRTRCGRRAAARGEQRADLAAHRLHRGPEAGLANRRRNPVRPEVPTAWSMRTDRIGEARVRRGARMRRPPATGTKAPERRHGAGGVPL